MSTFVTILKANYLIPSTFLLFTGVTEKPVKEVIPSIEFIGACTWHIMTLDFPKNVGHISDYPNCKNYVYDRLVNNTSSIELWEMYLAEAC